MNIHVAPVATTTDENSMEFKYFDQLHAQKYRDENQPKEDHIRNIAYRLSSSEHHFEALYDSLYYDRFLPAGRVQAAMGASEREVSAFNCSVSQTIHDDMRSIMDALTNAAMILRLGTGIGYNFSNIRPKGALIKKLKTDASGPISFMRMFDTMASTIASSGHRRGAQMGILNVSHPDIEQFIDAKMEQGAFTYFNISVGISDDFMKAVEQGTSWDLTFEDKVYKTVDARTLWDKIIKNAYDSAEPGIIFIDRLNDQNNLYYCEYIEATNPCAEQPLPPHGLCLLGSFNLPAYFDKRGDFQVSLLKQDIRNWVEAYDNIFEKSVYAIKEHEIEAVSKRRIGLGFTGIANAVEYLCGEPNYGEEKFCEVLDELCRILRDEAYSASIELAKIRGPFQLFDPSYLDGEFVRTLPDNIRSDLALYGIRNSHLISYAPCGTISLCAHNVSSGVEPTFHHEVARNVIMKEGKINVTLKDFNVRKYGFKGKTLEECSIEDHMRVAQVVQKYCDSAVSKTVNVASNCSYEEYEQIYKQAHSLGLKGITVYHPNEKRGIVIAKAEKKVEENKPIPVLSAFELIPTGCVSGACTL